MNGNGVSGVPGNGSRDHFSAEPRAELPSVQVSQREGGKLVLSLRKQGVLHESHSVVFVWFCTHVLSWTRIVDKVSITEIAEDTGLHRNTVSRALDDLTKHGVLHWMPGTGASYVSLTPEDVAHSRLCEEDAPAELPAEPSHTPEGATVGQPSHIPDSAPLQGVREQGGLTSAPDSVRAAVAVSEHLFHGKQSPPHVVVALTQWFADLPADSIDDVRARMLRGRPSAHIGNPEGYARKVFGNALRDHRRKLRSQRVSRETMPGSWDRSIDSSHELSTW